MNFDERRKNEDYIGFTNLFENCAKCQFWSDRDGGHVSAPISRVVVLHIISILVPNSIVAAARTLFRESSSLLSVLTLPFVNPPIERGLLSNLFSPSGGGAQAQKLPEVGLG